MSGIVTDAITERIDQAAYDEAQFRRTLIPALRQIGGAP